MVRKAVAALLFLLAASPFTAPFATCDIATLFGHADASIAGGWTSTTVIAYADPQSTTLCSTVQQTRTPFKPSTEARPEAARVVLFVALRDRRSQELIPITYPPVQLRI